LFDKATDQLQLTNAIRIALVASISRQPLAVTLSWAAVATWFGIVLIGSASASISPAIRAARLTIRQTLAYV
jgi:ABC-type lipoprotein release transport system permease subunit